MSLASLVIPIIIYTKGVNTIGGGGRRLFAETTMALQQKYNVVVVSIMPTIPGKEYEDKYQWSNVSFFEDWDDAHNPDITNFPVEVHGDIQAWFGKVLDVLTPHIMIFDTEYSYREFMSLPYHPDFKLPKTCVLVHDQLWRFDMGSLYTKYDKIFQDDRKKYLK